MPGQDRRECKALGPVAGLAPRQAADTTFGRVAPSLRLVAQVASTLRKRCRFRHRYGIAEISEQVPGMMKLCANEYILRSGE